MIKYRKLLENSAAYRLFAGDAARDTLNHCYLLESPDETALLELVKLMAALLACESRSGKPCLACPGCKRYETLSGGNALVYPRSGERIKKDDVLDLLQNIQYKAFEHGKKIAVLKAADRMDATVQNKLLKTLEEPPENVLFFLLAINANSLLPTIRSRSRLLVLERFPEEELLSELESRFGGSERLRDACSAAGGCVGTAEARFLDPDFEDLLGFAVDLLTGLRRESDFIKFSSRFDEVKERFPEFLDLVSLCLRDAMILAEGVGTPMLRSKSDRLSAVGASAQKLAGGIEAVHRCKRKLVYNCNAQSAYTMLLSSLLHILEV